MITDRIVPNPHTHPMKYKLDKKRKEKHFTSPNLALLLWFAAAPAVAPAAAAAAARHHGPCALVL